MKIQSINTQKFEPFIRDKIEKLNKQKLAAVQQEEYDEAKAIKIIVDKLLLIGNQYL